MRPLAKVAFALAIVGGVVGLLVATKPGPQRPGPSAAPPAGSSSRVGAKSAPSGRPGAPVTASSSGSAAPVLGSAWLEHGRDAVVRSQATVPASGQGLQPLLAAPRWEEPFSLKFFKLKGHYRSYRKRGAFDPQLLRELSGAAVEMTGAFMPIDPIPDDGRVTRFWLANPLVVMAGCVFCSPPTLADLVYVTTDAEPFTIDREKLFSSVVMLELLGRLRFGPLTTSDGVQYLFGLELRERLD